VAHFPADSLAAGLFYLFFPLWSQTTRSDFLSRFFAPLPEVPTPSLRDLHPPRLLFFLLFPPPKNPLVLPSPRFFFGKQQASVPTLSTPVALVWQSSPLDHCPSLEFQSPSTVPDRVILPFFFPLAFLFLFCNFTSRRPALSGEEFFSLCFFFPSPGSARQKRPPFRGPCASP